MGYNDYFERQYRRGSLGVSKPFPTSLGEAVDKPNDSVPVLDPEIDFQWAKGFDDTRAINNYLDYYYSGQDIMVHMEGLEWNGLTPPLPIMGLGFNVQQQKTPVYGFWSFTYDAVMRGNRIVNGAITLASQGSWTMRSALAKAATARQEKTSQYRGSPSWRSLTEDDENIEKYWGKTIDPALSRNQGMHPFSAHPPFNLVIYYGIQDISLDQIKAGDMKKDWEGYLQDNTLMRNLNERLVSNTDTPGGRIVLEACELQNFEENISPDGTPISETYTFFARDIVWPE